MTGEDYEYLAVLLQRWLADSKGPALTGEDCFTIGQLVAAITEWLTRD